MSQLHEAWNKVDTQLAEALNSWPKGVHVAVAMQRATEATAREIARKVFMPFQNTLMELNDRIKALETMAHYHGGMDLQDEQERAKTDAAMDAADRTVRAMDGATSEQDAPAPAHAFVFPNADYCAVCGMDREAHVAPAPSEGEGVEVGPVLWKITQPLGFNGYTSNPSEAKDVREKGGRARPLYSHETVHALVKRAELLENQLRASGEDLSQMERIAERHAETVQRLQRELDEAQRVVREAREVSDYLAGTDVVPDGMVDYARELYDKIDRLRREREAEQEANRQLQRLNDNQAETIQSFLDEEKQHAERLDVAHEYIGQLEAEIARLRGELDESLDRIASLKGISLREAEEVIERGTQIVELTKEIARLRDPGNWGVCYDVARNVHAPEYVGPDPDSPPVSEGKSDGE